VSLGCNVIPRNDGFNIARTVLSNCCGKPAVEVGLWYNTYRAEKTFVYPCVDHLPRLMELPFDGHHKQWYERVARIIR
jgi:hypothetical protein